MGERRDHHPEAATGRLRAPALRVDDTPAAFARLHLASSAPLLPDGLRAVVLAWHEAAAIRDDVPRSVRVAALLSLRRASTALCPAHVPPVRSRRVHSAAPLRLAPSARRDAAILASERRSTPTVRFARRARQADAHAPVGGVSQTRWSNAALRAHLASAPQHRCKDGPAPHSARAS